MKTFKVGDRVEHEDKGLGTIVFYNSPNCIHVKLDSGVEGSGVDYSWSTSSGMLTKVEQPGVELKTMETLKVGDRVDHKSHGLGVVVNIEDTWIHVKLDSGIKGGGVDNSWLSDRGQLTKVEPSEVVAPKTLGQIKLGDFYELTQDYLTYSKGTGGKIVDQETSQYVNLNLNGKAVWFEPLVYNEKGYHVISVSDPTVLKPSTKTFLKPSVPLKPKEETKGISIITEEMIKNGELGRKIIEISGIKDYEELPYLYRDRTYGYPICYMFGYESRKLAIHLSKSDRRYWYVDEFIPSTEWVEWIKVINACTKRLHKINHPEENKEG